MIKRALAVLSIITIAVAFFNDAEGQVRPKTFWDDVSYNLSVGVNNFHGDFDRLNGTSGDIVGLPFPTEGYHISFRLSKPLSLLDNPNSRFKAFAGGDFIHHRSKSVGASVPVDFSSITYAPINIINNAYGVNFGLSFEYNITDKLSIEPMIDVAYRLHNPRTDGLVNQAGSIVTLNQNIPGLPSSVPPYDLRDIPETRVAGLEANAVSEGLASGAGGMRLSRQFIGNYKWFLQYSYMIFFDDYFDNTSRASSPSEGANDNDAMSMLKLGLSFPVVKDKRRTEEVTKPRVRIDRDKIAKIERIQNIANLVTTDEDLRELQRVMSDKILLYDTPGVRFNELAAEVEDRQVNLADSDINSEMVELPGGSFIMGLTSVDELNIQVQGRKRITINPFMIDKYEVTNEQYRAFLIAMGAIDAPRNVDPADTALANADYGAGMDWDDLLETASLTDYRTHANPPTLNGPEDLMPDSLQWQRMGLNDVIPWKTYFYDQFYDNYPVVCVNWYQAKLYAAWSGKRLPTESEWEFAARSGISGRVYPWDGLEVQTKTGKYRANFKQDRGVYQADGYAIMAPVESFVPNDFGLYNMAGNVSEWVLDSYNPSYVVLQNVGTSNFVSPSYTNDQEPRKIHRGGSWQSTKFFIGVGVRNFQDKNLGTPFVGFRCAKSVARRYR